MIPFSQFYGLKKAKLALILNAIDPKIGGVILIGRRGTGKSSLIRAFKNILPDEVPFLDAPLNITEDALCGSIDIEGTIKKGKRVFQPGVLSRVDGGFLFIDEINLLNPEIVSIIFEVQERGENVVEREGLSISSPSRFSVLATMNPEEGDISPHILDRFGMCVVFDGVSERRRKIAMKLHSGVIKIRTHWDRILRERIESAKNLLEKLELDDEILSYITSLSLSLGAFTHRADITLAKAARAYAAFKGDRSVRKEHVDGVLELVMTHRRRSILPPPEEEERDGKNERDSEERDTSPSNTTGKAIDLTETQETGGGREEIFEVGRVFPVKRFYFRKDRIFRKGSLGRRSGTRFSGRSGRYVKAVMRRNENDIAIDATIRAASCYQRIRGRRDRLIIKEEDFRFRERERKVGHLFVFVVDSSGSMGVKRRMVEVKGAVMSLLMDCYKMRDRVSLIVFRNDGAEVILPPTKSVELASKSLKEIPTGGRTPLGAGLLKAYEISKNELLKRPSTKITLIIITDGRVNKSISHLPPMEEAERILYLLRELNVNSIVVDTQAGGLIRSDFPMKMAEILSSPYFTLDALKADTLVSIVKKEAFG